MILLYEMKHYGENIGLKRNTFCKISDFFLENEDIFVKNIDHKAV